MSGFTGTALPPGIIFDIARAAGMSIREQGDKRPIKCPLHGDRNASPL